MKEECKPKTKVMFNFINGTSIKIKSPGTRAEIEAIFNTGADATIFTACNDDNDIKSSSILIVRSQLQSIMIAEIEDEPVRKVFGHDGIVQ